MHILWTLCSSLTQLSQWRWLLYRPAWHSRYKAGLAVTSQAQVIAHISHLLCRHGHKLKTWLQPKITAFQYHIRNNLHKTYANSQWKRFVPCWAQIGSHHLCLGFCFATVFWYKSYFHIWISQSIRIHWNQIFCFINCTHMHTCRKCFVLKIISLSKWNF